jgi:hypothetical protein
MLLDEALGTIKLRKPVQVGVRHVESDGWVVDGLDGLGLGQVLVDGPRGRDGARKILGDGMGKEEVQKGVWYQMGLREGQRQQQIRGNVMDAKTPCWMGLREG